MSTVAIPLPLAWFCESCQVILNNSRCCYCASAEHTFPIYEWLNRELPPIELPRRVTHLLIVPERGPREVERHAPVRLRSVEGIEPGEAIPHVPVYVQRSV